MKNLMLRKVSPANKLQAEDTPGKEHRHLSITGDMASLLPWQVARLHCMFPALHAPNGSGTLRRTYAARGTTDPLSSKPVAQRVLLQRSGTLPCFSYHPLKR